MRPYNRLNPLHWLVALFSNSRKSDYLKQGTLHVVESPYKATKRVRYWLRNPAHDFTHFVVGFQGEPDFSTVWERKPARAPRGLGLALRRYRWLWLPWVYWGGRRVVFYAGWSDGGALGFKLRRAPDYMRG